MRGRVKVLMFVSLALLNVSCVNQDEVALRAKVTSPLSAPSPSNEWKDDDIRRFVEIELQYNRRYIEQVKQTLEHSFENQLSMFEENELGFFSSFGHMFQVVFWNDAKLNDVWNVKASKYFNTIDVKTAAYQCYEEYIKDLSTLRSNFVHTSRSNLPQSAKLDLPQDEIYLGALESHAKINWGIELGVEALVWIAVLILFAIISIFVAVPTSGFSLIVTILATIISVVLSIRNDNRLLNDLREQHINRVEIDYGSILKELDKNTYYFYENR